MVCDVKKAPRERVTRLPSTNGSTGVHVTPSSFAFPQIERPPDRPHIDHASGEHVSPRSSRDGERSPPHKNTPVTAHNHLLPRHRHYPLPSAAGSSPEESRRASWSAAIALGVSASD